MNIRRALGILILVIGIACIVTGQYIKVQVEEGKEKISSAQQTVDQGKSLFSLSPYTKPVGKTITDSAQKKIDAGSEQVNYYEEMVGWLQMGGIVLILVGIIVILIPRKSRR